MKSKKTTNEDFELFKLEINRLLKKLCVDTWHIYFSLEKLEDCNARCSPKVIARSATFFLNTSIYLYTAEEIKQTALHEVCHLLIADLSDLAYSRFVGLAQLEQTEESTARKIGAILMELGI